VESLSRAAGISKGAFYAFFPSKEELFLALLDEHEERVHAEVEAAVRADPARGVEGALAAALHATDDPLLSAFMSEEGLAVLRTLPPERQELLLRRDEAHVARLVGVLADAGTPIAVPPEIVLALLRSLVFVGGHRADVGPELLDALQAWLAPLLRSALLAPTPEPAP
jgi:AcrR family transcriptional regulator